MGKGISINLNDYVECELTDFGVKMITREGFNPEYIGSSGNMIRIQLWELMNEFGDCVFNGADNVIVGNTISINKENNKT
ncbi:MAG: hypothetical protein ACR2PH_04715 [Desulfobulbia bacterium]